MLKGGEIKNWLAKEVERERERERENNGRNGDRKIFETDKTETVWTKSVRDRDGKREIDWVFIWTNLQNKNVWIMKREFELWKRASLF